MNDICMGICSLLWLITMFPMPRIWMGWLFHNTFIGLPPDEDGSDATYLAYLGMNE
jgi:hypothetical protein